MCTPHRNTFTFEVYYLSRLSLLTCSLHQEYPCHMYVNISSRYAKIHEWTEFAFSFWIKMQFYRHDVQKYSPKMHNSDLLLGSLLFETEFQNSKETL